MSKSRRIILSAIAGCVFVAYSVAQSPSTELPMMEMYGGYSLLYAPSGSATSNGFIFSPTHNINKWASITASFSYQHFDRVALFPAIGAPLRQNGWTSELLGGPRFSLRRNRWRVFGESKVGAVHSLVHSDLTAAGGAIGSFSATGFGLTLGGGLDLPINRRFAIRPVQADYLFTRINGFNANRFLYSAGLVIRFYRR
jgi:hypothetical protein